MSGEVVNRGKARKKVAGITNEDIPRVGPDTPGGQWLRRYWMAVGTTMELCDIPQAVRILGEDLVLFRDLSGRLGLVGQSCSHRGASLEYGDIEPQGIRCPYHGWLFDIHGNCLEQPSEPLESTFCTKIKAGKASVNSCKLSRFCWILAPVNSVCSASGNGNR